MKSSNQDGRKEPTPYSHEEGAYPTTHLSKINDASKKQTELSNGFKIIVQANKSFPQQQHPSI